MRIVSICAAAGLLLTSSAVLHAQSGPKQLAVDLAASDIYVVTYRTGLFSFLGHDHAIIAPAWTAELCWDGEEPAASHGRFQVNARELIIDSPEARALAGMGKGPSQNRRQQIQQKLRDRMAVEQYPWLQFATEAIGRVDDRNLALRGNLTMKGVTRVVDFPIAIESTASNGMRMSGVVTVRQSDFGIKPESIAGVVKVADKVDIHIIITATPTNLDCALSGG